MARTNERIAWIDMARGYGILAVILGHLQLGFFERWLYTFHLPLFFFLSGFCFSEGTNFSAFVRRKCKSMVMPYFWLSIPLLLFDGSYACLSGHTFQESLWLIPRFLIQRRMWTLWFLTCLFCLNVIFYAVLRAVKTDAKLAVCSVAALLLGLIYYSAGGVALPWNVDVCFTAFPFFFAGYFCKGKREYINRYLSDARLSIGTFALLGIINAVCGYLTIQISGSGLEMYYCSYGFAPFTYISAFAGIGCVVIFSRWFVLKPVQYIGSNSLVYFAWHQTIMIPVSAACLSFVQLRLTEGSSLFETVVYKTLQLGIIVSILTVCNMFIMRTKLRFLLGK